MHVCIFVLILLKLSIASVEELITVQLVAIHGYKQFLTRCLDDEAKQNYQLSTSETAENAVLGNPIKLMEIAPHKIVRYTEETEINTILKPMDIYLFPILFHNHVKLLMSVDRYPGQDYFEIGSLGYLWLAQEVDSIMHHWTEQQGYSLVICVNMQTNTHAFWIPQKGQYNLTIIDPLGRNRSIYPLLSSLDETMRMLKRHFPTLIQGGN